MSQLIWKHNTEWWGEKINKVIVSNPDRKIKIRRRITTHITSTMAMAEKNRDDDR